MMSRRNVRLQSSVATPTRLRWWATVFVPVMSSCIVGLAFGQPGNRTAPVVRTYRESDRPPEQWRVGTTPRYVIGGPGAPSEAEFQQVGPVVVMPDGGVAIGDIMTAEIRIFDGRGRYLHTIGRRGRGPGEFDGVWGLWRVADTLVGVDGMGVSQMLTTAGQYVRTVPRPMAMGLRMSRIGYLAEGSLIGYAADGLDKVPRGRGIRHFNLVRVHPDGTRQPLGQVRGVQTVWDGTRAPERLVYGARLARATMSDRICTGFPAEEYRFTCIDPEGRPLVEVHRPGIRGPRVTDADRQTFFHLVDSSNPSPRNAEYRRAVRRTTVFAGRMPPFARFVASLSDELWVGPMVAVESGGFPNPVPPGPTVWSVFSKDGIWLSEVTLPAHFRLVGATADAVLGVVLKPEEGTDKIVAYQLLRR